MTLKEINQAIVGTGLELYGTRGSYCLISIYDEGSIFFQASTRIKTQNYKTLKEKSLKQWIKTAKQVSTIITKGM